MTPKDAREHGYVKGVAVEVAGTFRKMTGRITVKNNCLIAMGGSPFVIYANGEWKARILKKEKV